MKKLFLVCLAALSVATTVTTFAQGNDTPPPSQSAGVAPAGVTLSDSQLATIDSLVKEAAAKMPASEQSTVDSVLKIVGTLMIIGRVFYGIFKGGLFQGLHGLFTGSNTPNPPGNIPKGATLLMLLLCLAFAARPASAQPTSNTNTIPNFLSQVEDWALNVNTNYDWTNVTLQVESGYKQTTGYGAANYIGVTYDPNILGKTVNFGIEGQFYGAGSAFNGAEARLGYVLFKKSDFKLEAAAYGGYDNTRPAAVGEVELRAVKMLTVNTYTTASYSQSFYSKGKFNSNGQVRVGAGFVF